MLQRTAAEFNGLVQNLPNNTHQRSDSFFYTQLYMHTHTHTLSYTDTHTYTLNAVIHTHTHIHTCTVIVQPQYSNTHTHIHIHTCTVIVHPQCSNTHTHTHTHNTLQLQTHLVFRCRPQVLGQARSVPSNEDNVCGKQNEILNRKSYKCLLFFQKMAPYGKNFKNIVIYLFLPKCYNKE